MIRPKTLIFAAGTAKGGASGAEKLILASRDGRLGTDIAGIVSNYEFGGAHALSFVYDIPFFFFPKPWDAASYQRIAEASGADFFALSGWLKLVEGLDPNTRFNSRTVFNIHPSLIPKFCGLGWHGHHVHEAVIPAYKRGEITHTGLTMHFVNNKFDEGPIIFQCLVEISDDDTPDTIGTKVNVQEHIYQWEITNQVVTGKITWDGVNPDSLVFPPGYEIVRHA